MAMLTRERLAEVIRNAYAGDPPLEGPPDPNICLDCCWGNTCPAHAADAVLAALSTTNEITRTNGDAL